MTDSDLILPILRDIRDRVDQTNARLDQTNARLDRIDVRIDESNARIDETDARLDKRFQQVVSIVKHLDGQVIILGRYLKNRTEKEIRDLQTRVSKLERKDG